MYGWRARIGVVLPCTNTTMEPEFNQLASVIPGIAIYSSRMHIEITDKGLTTEALREMEPQAMNFAIPELIHAGVDIIVYGCTSGSFIEGIGWDQKILKKIQEMTSIPATTASTGVVAALKHLKINKIALGTPYDNKITTLGKTFLENSGFNVVNSIGLNNLAKLREGSVDLAYRLGRLTDTSEAECVFISCTKFPTIDAVCHLENDLEKPVISSNIATFWHALKILCIKPCIRGYGKLLEGQ